MPHLFRVAMPNGECVLNKTVSLELMKLDGQSVLHAVDKDTRFRAACFLTCESAHYLSESLLCIWVAPYI